MSDVAPKGGIAFLFGAGASFAVGSEGHVLPAGPPLTNGEDGLYHCLAKEFPVEWGPTSGPGRYAAEFRTDFEAAYTTRVLRPSHLSQSLSSVEQQLPLARFFAQFALSRGGVDLYSKLLAGIRDLGLLDVTTFGSLNYDSLFEQAAEHLGLPLEWLLEAAASRLQARPPVAPLSQSVRVAKLHGSSNFLIKSDQRLRAMLTSATAIEARIDPRSPAELARNDVAARVFSPDGYFAIMSQVSPNKEHLLSPATILQIRQIWAEAVRQAAVVVVIGVRPLARDKHVWNPLQATSPLRFYIGEKSHFGIWSAANNTAWHYLDERWENVDVVLDKIRQHVCSKT